jgi:hypothetical protein
VHITWPLTAVTVTSWQASAWSAATKSDLAQIG